MFEQYIENNKGKMMNDLKKLISYRSVSITSQNAEFPFGKECSNCLHYVLNLAASLGFTTKNIDEYCGYIEFGSGKDLIGIVGHLDVVPANENWNYPPYNATIKDGKIYGRGALDDKGPVIATIYAMKAVMNNYSKINKRVRLILGLNEEKAWQCIKHYKEKEEIPQYGFSPDANFPVIFAEKGVLSYWFEEEYQNNKNIIIKKIDCNNAFNVVPEKCTFELEVMPNINISNIIIDLKVIGKEYNYNIDIEKIKNNTIKVTTYGKAAHSAYPELGENAISKLIIILNDVFEKYECNNELFQFFKTKIGTEYNGQSLNINISDETGKLTLNVAKVILEDNKLKIGINLRIPATISINQIEEKLERSINNYNNLKSYTHAKSNPLYVNPENKIIKVLLEIYNSKTKSNLKPVAIGGATFARAFKNFVSFGPVIPGDKDMCHQNDEYITIDNLMLCANLYADAIYKLCSEI